MTEAQSHASGKGSRDGPSASTIVSTGGLTKVDWMIQGVILCSFPVAALFIVFLSGPKPPLDVAPRLSGIVVMLAVLDLLIEEIVSVRQIRLDSSGVTFRFRLHSEHRSWSDLRPSKLVPMHGDWGVTSDSRGGKRTVFRGYRLTLAQAQALLRHPNCPPWDLPEPVREGLGLTQIAQSGGAAR
jgi:hypothetical protein